MKSCVFNITHKCPWFHIWDTVLLPKVGSSCEINYSIASRAAKTPKILSNIGCGDSAIVGNMSVIFSCQAA
jgi:hypothetical protein